MRQTPLIPRFAAGISRGRGSAIGLAALVSLAGLLTWTHRVGQFAGPHFSKQVSAGPTGESTEDQCRSRLVAMNLPESTILNPDCTKPCVTAFGHKDGLGAQLGHIFAALMWAKATSREFRHAGISQLAHLQDYVSQDRCPMLKSHEARDGVTYLFCDPKDVDAAACDECVAGARVELENFMGLHETGSDVETTCENVPFDAAMKVGLISSKMEGIGHRKANCEVRKAVRKLYSPTDPSKKQIESDLGYSDTSVDVALHIRKGDAMKYKNRLNLSENDVVVAFEDHISKKLEALANGRPVCVHIFSEGKAAWFESTCARLSANAAQAGFKPGCADSTSSCVAHINTDLKHTFHGMVAADVLVVGGSSLSRTAGIINSGLVLDRVFLDKANSLGVVNYHQVYEHRKRDGLRKVDGILMDPYLQNPCVLDPDAQLQNINAQINAFGAAAPASFDPHGFGGAVAGTSVDPTSATTAEIQSLRAGIAAAKGLPLNAKGQAKLASAQARLAMLEQTVQNGTASPVGVAVAAAPAVGDTLAGLPQPAALTPVSTADDTDAPGTEAASTVSTSAATAEIQSLRAGIAAAKGLTLNAKGQAKLASAQARLAWLEGSIQSSPVGVAVAAAPAVGDMATSTMPSGGEAGVVNLSPAAEDPVASTARINVLRQGVQAAQGMTLNAKGQAKLAAIKKELETLEGSASSTTAMPMAAPVESAEAAAMPMTAPVESAEAAATPLAAPVESAEAATPVAAPVESAEAAAMPVAAPVESAEAAAMLVAAPVESAEAATPVAAPVESAEAAAMPVAAPRPPPLPAASVDSDPPSESAVEAMTQDRITVLKQQIKDLKDVSMRVMDHATPEYKQARHDYVDKKNELQAAFAALQTAPAPHL